MTIDLTGISVALIGGVFSIIGTVFLAWLQQHIKDKAAADTLSNAVANSLGAIQQAATGTIDYLKPHITIPGVSAATAVGVDYVLANAGPEAERLGITPESIAGKIEAKIGLAQIQTNLAVAASAVPLIPAPLDAIPTIKAVATAALPDGITIPSIPRGPPL